MTPLLLVWGCTRPDPPPPGDDAPDTHTTADTATAHSATPTPTPPSHTGRPCESVDLPPPPVLPGFEDCPTFDWVVHLFSGSDDRVERVVALPGGDTVVAGTFTGVPEISTDCQRARHAIGPLNVFVERLAPDGTQRWAHTLTGGYDGKFGDLALSPRGDVWVVGSYGQGPLQVDGVEVGGVDHRFSNPFAVQFAPDGTRKRTLLAAAGEGSNAGHGVAEDDAGNVYLLGTWSIYPLTVGPFTLDAHDSSVDDGFLAAFGPDDTPLWLTGITLRREDFGGSAPLVQPNGLALVGSKLMANIRLSNGTQTLIRPAGGAEYTLDLGDSDHTLIPFDPATGAALDNTTQISMSYFQHLEGTGPTSGRIGGDTGGTWTDTQGVEHVVEGAAVRQNPFVAEIDELGGLVSMRHFDDGGHRPVCCLESVQVQPDASAWAAVTTNREAPLGVDTARAWTPPPGTDSMVDLFDAFGRFHCGAALAGGRNRVFDLAVDELGGVVFVGEFAGELQIELPGGRAARRVGESTVIYDGFIARLAPP